MACPLAAVRRVGGWGDGYFGTGADPATIRQLYDIAQDAWHEAGRSGRPRFVMGLYWGLGPDAAKRGGAYIRDYYGFLGPMVEMIAGSILSTPEAIAGAIQAYGEVGVDEVALWPTIADPEQVDRLSDVADRLRPGRGGLDPFANAPTATRRRLVSLVRRVLHLVLHCVGHLCHRAIRWQERQRFVQPAVGCGERCAKPTRSG